MDRLVWAYCRTWSWRVKKKLPGLFVCLYVCLIFQSSAVEFRWACTHCCLTSLFMADRGGTWLHPLLLYSIHLNVQHDVLFKNMRCFSVQHICKCIFELDCQVKQVWLSSSDLVHQQGVFTHRTADNWLFLFSNHCVNFRAGNLQEIAEVLKPVLLAPTTIPWSKLAGIQVFLIKWT